MQKKSRMQSIEKSSWMTYMLNKELEAKNKLDGAKNFTNNNSQTKSPN